MKKIIAACCLTFFFVSFISVEHSDAKGRTGSHRTGGTNSHGKGSHYVGGRR
jgi:hypothetical protein